MKIHEWIGCVSSRTGKTHKLATLIQSMGVNEGMLLVRNEREARRIRGMYNIQSESIQSVDLLMGRHVGIAYIDPDACYDMVENETRPLHKEIAELNDKLKLAEEAACLLKQIVNERDAVERVNSRLQEESGRIDLQLVAHDGAWIH